MARILYVEPTPNPMAFKIRLDQRVTEGAGRHYTKKEEAWESPVAQALFDIHGVESVFLLDDFITINKTAGGIWDFIFFKADEIMTAAGVIPPVKGEGGRETQGVATGDFEGLTPEEKMAQIDRVLNETIRPGLARDGGGLEVLGLEENVLRIRYQGACGSCPSALFQTLGAISSLLQSRVSPNLKVVPA